MRYGIVFILALTLTACQSPTRELSKSANDIRKDLVEQQQALTDAQTAQESGTDPGPFIALALKINAAIQDTVDTIVTLIPELQDRKTAWDRLVELWKLIVILLIIVAVLIAGWAYGVAPLVKRVFAMIGLIPSTITGAAKLLQENKPEEAIAVLRTDPTFNAAFVAEKKKASQKRLRLNEPIMADTSRAGGS
jgi:hypothetical protein